MSDTTRAVGGPPPKKTTMPDASRLFADNRTASPAAPATESIPVIEQPTAVVARPSFAPTLVEPVAPAVQPVEAAAASDQATTTKRFKVTITVRDEAELRRIQAAFKRASIEDPDLRLNDWGRNLLLAETARLEQMYNAGQPFPWDGKRLRVGRPVGS